jgi:hypothetical protein
LRGYHRRPYARVTKVQVFAFKLTPQLP